MNATLMIIAIDEFLAELGTSGIVDARKARDQLMDLRLMCMTMEAEMDIISVIGAENVPTP